MVGIRSEIRLGIEAIQGVLISSILHKGKLPYSRVLNSLLLVISHMNILRS